MRRSVCMDAQAGLHLCCSQTTEDRFSHVEAQMMPSGSTLFAYIKVLFNSH